MLKKIAMWFGCLGLSFIAQLLSFNEQPKAFMLIYLTVTAVVLLVVLIIALCKEDSVKSKISAIIIVILMSALAVGLAFLFSLGVSKLFGVDFFVAFEIVTLGECLISNKKKD